MSVAIPEWPPNDSDEKRQALLDLAVDWALSNSLILRPNPPSPNSAVHGPFSLYPTPFPKHLFHTAEGLQEAYNDLYINLTCDEAFLQRIIGDGVARVDEFQRGLWNIWQQVRREGLDNDWHLGLFRSDYLLHCPSNAAEMGLKQVEFNTISSSFGALSAKVSELHSLLATSQSLYAASSFETALPANLALQELAGGLARAHDAYQSDKTSKSHLAILMIVQDPERNAFDQRALEWWLRRRGIIVVRKSFSQLQRDVQLEQDRALYVKSAFEGSEPLEVSVVYFRAGYTPRDYPTQAEWDTRLLLERSKAIKCPTIALQLAGAKKVQQVLASETNLLESHLSPQYLGQAHLLRKTFMGMWPLDESTQGLEGQKLAREQSQRFVLKPQREGGGNNIYRSNICPALDAMAQRDSSKSASAPKEQEGYILMELIEPPKNVKNCIVKAGEGKLRECEVVSELGIYGVALFRKSPNGKGLQVDFNRQAGHLLRTKGSDDDEGGVAVGFSVIDSPLLY